MIKIKLPSNVPSFYRILTIHTKTSNKKYKVIDSILGKKLLIKAIINTRIIYEGDACSGEVFYYYEKAPFFAVISYDSLIKSVVIANEGLESITFNNTEVQLSVLISINIYKHIYVNELE